MSDNINNSSEYDLDSILAEVRGSKYGLGSAAADKSETNEVSETASIASEANGETPSKTWSLDDIDRLIAEENGEEYVPKKRPAPIDFNSDMFTVKPLDSVPDARNDEYTDISSTSDNAEIDGQETLFEESDDFDEALFEIETVIVPDDIPAPEINKYARSQPEETTTTAKRPEITPFYEGDKPASDFFKKTEEETPVFMQEEQKSKSMDYKTRFFTSLKIDLPEDIDDDEPELPYEKPGFILTKSNAQAENGLEPLPRVVSAEDAINMEKTKVVEGVSAEKKQPSYNSDDVEGQIMLMGFDDEPEEQVPVKDNESDVEETLWEKRRQKAKSFKLVDTVDLDEEFSDDFEIPTQDLTKEEKARQKKQKKLEQQRDVEERLPVNEYTMPAEKAPMLTKLTENSKSATVGMIVVGVIGLIDIFVNLLPKIAMGLGIETTLFAAGSSTVCVINTVLIIAVAAYNNIKFIDGFTTVLSGNLTSDTVVSLSIAVALVQNALTAVLGGRTIDSSVFSSAAILAVFLSKFAEKLDAQRILENFQVCAYKYEHNMYAVHSFENESEIFEIGRGLMMGNAELLYSSKLAFPSDFIKNSTVNSTDKKLIKIMIPVSAGAAFAVSVAAGIINKDIMTALSAFAAVFCICSPIFSAFIPALIARINNKSLNYNGTMIAGLDAAEKIASANAVVMDSADIFDKTNCTMHGMKDFKTIRIDDVLLYAAALVIKSGGPLRECFEQAVSSRQDLLPQVKELVYEDKLGIAARIHNQKVLFGNRNLLIHHNIEVPEKAIEDKYARNGRKVMYLAVAGKPAALFVVSYAVDKNLAGYFKTLESNGIQVLVRTNDVNVTEELISSKFELPQQTFKVLSSVAGRLFKRRKDAVCDKLSVKIVHDGTAYSMLKAVASSCSMVSSAKLGSVLQIIISALGFAACTALYCTANSAFVTNITTLLFLLASGGIAAGLLFLKRVK